MAKKPMIKYLAIGITILILVFAAKSILLGNATPTKTTNIGTFAPIASDGVQEVNVGIDRNFQYTPNPIKLKVGVKTRLIIDLNQVGGCMRAIQIPSLGVQKLVKQGDNIIEFTPTKSGTFRMQCSMGMGQGVVIVEESAGTVAAATDLNDPAPAGGCGMGGGCGGCGA